MRAFSVKNDKTYSKEYYNLFYDTFFAETKSEAIEQAKKSLADSDLHGKFDLVEFGDDEYHCEDGIICGKLEPLKACSYSPGGWGIVYKCLECNEEIDDSQSELFYNGSTMQMDKQTITTLRNQCQNIPIYSDPRFPPSPYYRFLRALAAHMKPELSVELGVCGGGGSLHLALGWPNGIVVGVDFAWDHEENLKHIIENYPNFHFLKEDSVEAAQQIHATHGDIDILFIDTTHTYEQTMAEYHAYLPYLSARAVVCLDDLFRPGMDRVWAEMPEPKVRLDTLHISEAGGGFGVVFNEH